MRYRISQIKLDIDQSHDDLKKTLLGDLKDKSLNIYDIKIIKESIDARKKHNIKLVYTLEFSCDQRLELPEAKTGRYELPQVDFQKRNYLQEAVNLNNKGSKHYLTRPVVVGFGPCGIFAALILAEAGLKPIIIERGEPVDERVKSVNEFWQGGELNPESNVQFGEGGAGTFSDGKLTTGIKDIRISKVLEEFVEAGADESILYKQKPHIGTDRLRNVVKNLRRKIEALGGEIKFDMRFTGIKLAEESGAVSLRGIEIRKTLENCEMPEPTEDSPAYTKCIETDNLVLAIGHSARDTFKMLLDNGIYMEQKPFSIGVRIEHLQEMMDKVQYGEASLAGRLGPADYKLSHRCKSGRGVYTFCMCPGGEVINASSEPETAVTNGMSNSSRDGKYANSGLLVDVRTDDFGSDHPLAGVEFQRKYEELAYTNGEGRLPKSNYGKFKSNKEDPVRKSLPEFAAESITEAMPYLGRKLKGFDRDDSILTAVETRSSSPVRIKRDDKFQSNIAGIFPAGEGAGYAGGIMSAAVDGIKIAEAIISKHISPRG